MSRLYSVDMGEGVAGHIRTVQAMTTNLDTCMGVVFFNETTEVAGLYHYPARTIVGDYEDPRVEETMRLMIADIRPTHIFLTPGQYSTEVDILDVSLFLRGAAPRARFQKLRSKSSSYFVLLGREFQVNRQLFEYKDITASVESRVGFEEFEHTYTGTRRAITGGFYYGVNMW
jgi:hypothetical protein